MLLKTENLFPGYYKRPEVTADVFDADGYYRTGDVVAEVGPDRLVYVDRRNSVVKLSRANSSPVAKLEAVFVNSPLVQQIYVYGNSARPFLLAVVVPTDEALAGRRGAQAADRRSLQSVAKVAGLQPYEIPRDFIIETSPFSVENGLLAGTGKPASPKLKERYGERLESCTPSWPKARPTIEAKCAAAAPTHRCCKRSAGPRPRYWVRRPRPVTRCTLHRTGGDSLSALTFGNLLHEIFDVDVPVGVIVSPANDLQAIADYIEGERHGTKRPTFASVHGRDAVEVHAGDLTLDKFIDAATLAAAPPAAPSAEVRTVLLTGATGFLGRYLSLDWLDRMDLVDGKVIALVRAKSDEDARGRLDKIFDSGDPDVSRAIGLAADYLEVLAGDKGEADLGLEVADWQRLAETVDPIVDPAALVNHVLPYSELFGPMCPGPPS